MTISCTDYTVDETTGCWNWNGTKTVRGYPSAKQHRTYYAETYGVTLTPDLHVHHKCRNTSCVNPEHLEAIDAREHFKHHFLDELAGITLEDVEAIRELGRQPGVRAEVVAEQYGIHWDTVNRYWRGEGWEFFLGDGGPCRPEGRMCVHCGGEIAIDKQRHARYCSVGCRNRAGALRRRAGIRSPGGSNGRFFAHNSALEGGQSGER